MRTRAVPRPLALLLVVAAGLLGGCSAVPVRTIESSPDDVYAEVVSNVLNSDAVSAESRVAIERAFVHDTFDDDRVEALRRLQSAALQIDRRDRLFALAEVANLAARETGDRRLYLASAAYAWLFLLGDAEDPVPGPFDVRFRVAADLYNRGVAQAFFDEEKDAWTPAAGRVDLPAGAIDVVHADASVTFGTTVHDRFFPAENLRIEGLRARGRVAGLGAPLVASASAGVAGDLYLEGVRRPVTAVVRFDGGLEDLAAGRMRADLRLVRAGAGSTMDWNGTTLPLESDRSASLAATIDEAGFWDFELAGFFGSSRTKNRIFLGAPHERGRIPVVFVHGTASSPARWAEILNELSVDPVILENFEFWFFQYQTSAPILASAASLRSEIDRVLKEIDPEGADPALRRMVVIGHSQGGLLTRLLITDSGDRIWSKLSGEPYDRTKFSPEDAEFVESVVFFEPRPDVARVVFLATPHQGSRVVSGLVQTVTRWFVTLPRRVMDRASSALRMALGTTVAPDLDNAVDNMRPGSRFNVTLATCPMAPDVPKHSVVGVIDIEDPEASHDTVVDYTSAHLPEATSEIVIHHDHSLQGDPRTIAEIRRVLRLHAAENAVPTAPPAAAR